MSKGRRYLAHQAVDRGIQSLLGLDAGFGQTLAPRELRAFVSEQGGGDIGFDAGDEAFSSMIALKLFGASHPCDETTKRSVALVQQQVFRGRYRFFTAAGGCASDTDCTAVSAAALYEAGAIGKRELVASAEQLLLAAAPANVPASENGSNGELLAGVVMVSWDDALEPGAPWRGRRQDAAVAANALYALKLAAEVGLTDPRGIITATWAYVREHLESGAYLQGTRDYPSPDTFLYYVSCLCRSFSECHEAASGALRRALDLRDAAALRAGRAGDAAAVLGVAQRAIARVNLGLRPDVEALLRAQSRGGSWPVAPFCRLGDRGPYLGSSALTALFAVAAIEESMWAASGEDASA